MKRDSVSTYAHIRRDTPLPLYTPVHILDEPPPFRKLRTCLGADYIEDFIPG